MKKFRRFRRLLLVIPLLLFGLVFSVQNSFGAAAIAITSNATEAVATITSDATTATYYIEGGTFAVSKYVESVTNIQKISQIVSCILLNSATPTINNPGDYTRKPSGYFSSGQTFDNVYLELLGQPDVTAVASELMQIGIIDQYKKPFYIDTRPYSAIVIRFHFLTGAIPQFKAFFQKIPVQNTLPIELKF